MIDRDTIDRDTDVRDAGDRDAAVLERLLATRHSCRAFRPDPVPDATIERIVAIAGRTASWCNAQPWQLEITRGAATEAFRTAMSAHAAAAEEPVIDYDWPRAYEGVYLERRRLCGFALYESLGIGRGDRAAYGRQAQENFRLFGAPHVAIVSSDDALGTYGAVDCGAFVANFLTAATALGVATIAQAALASHAGLVRAHFGLPRDRRIVCGISFGYADTDHPANRFRTERAGLDEVLRWHDG